jgi:hypothetical protein
MRKRQGMLFDLEHGRWQKPEDVTASGGIEMAPTKETKAWKAIGKLNDRMKHTEAPWFLAKSGRSVNLPDGGKVRFEAGPMVKHNARVVSVAPALVNASFEALWQLARIENPDRAVRWTMAVLLEQLAFALDEEKLEPSLRKVLGIKTSQHYEKGGK